MRTLVRSTTRQKPTTIPHEFNWLKHLNSDEQAKFFAGLLSRLVPSVKNDDWSQVVEWVEEWKATANVHADSQVAHGLRQARQELARGEAVDWETLRRDLAL